MKNAIILHGMPSKEQYYDPSAPSQSKCHWIDWLQRQLIIKDIPTATPEMPHSYEPNYEIWKKEFERYDITPETILVGHSCGGGFLVRWLSDNKDVKVGKVVLVAPWINPIKEDYAPGFFDFIIDENVAKRTNGITIFGSDDDFETIKKSIEILRESIAGVKYSEFNNYGHFCYNDMGTKEFPELLEKVS